MKKVFAIVLTVVMVMAMFAGCGASADENSPVVKIGTPGPLTGDYAAYGVAVEAGMQIAVDEINALEEEADRLYAEAIHRLYVEEKDPVYILSWTTMYNCLE